MNCDLCSEVGEGIVVAHCTDCDQLLCDHHMLDHKKTKLTKDHELILFAQEQFDANNANTDHGSNLLHSPLIPNQHTKIQFPTLVAKMLQVMTISKFAIVNEPTPKKSRKHKNVKENVF